MKDTTGKKLPGSVTEITVHDPSGAQEILYSFAKRLGTLDGKVIAELAVDPVKWQTHRTFPVIEEEIKKKYPGVKFISYPIPPGSIHQR